MDPAVYRATLDVLLQMEDEGDFPTEGFQLADLEGRAARRGIDVTRWQLSAVLSAIGGCRNNRTWDIGSVKVGLAAARAPTG